MLCKALLPAFTPPLTPLGKIIQCPLANQVWIALALIRHLDDFHRNPFGGRVAAANPQR
jgi:hypothetical protein